MKTKLSLHYRHLSAFLTLIAAAIGMKTALVADPGHPSGTDTAAPASSGPMKPYKEMSYPLVEALRARSDKGKPMDEADALRMLRMLNGRPHEVHTGVALVSAAGVRSAVDTTRVWFSAMTDEDISWYVATGEPVDRAGAYAIQGFASRFIPRIDGSYSNVVGLPVALVSSILNEG